MPAVRKKSLGHGEYHSAWPPPPDALLSVRLLLQLGKGSEGLPLGVKAPRRDSGPASAGAELLIEMVHFLSGDKLKARTEILWQDIVKQYLLIPHIMNRGRFPVFQAASLALCTHDSYIHTCEKIC